MKKILAAILAAMMLMSTAVACTDNVETPETPDTNDQNQTESGDETPDTPEVDDKLIAPNVEHETLGYLFFEKFVELKKGNPAITTEEIANEIMLSKLGTAVQFPMVMPVEPGYLSGFNNESEFGGFTSATLIAPGMMGVAFVAYIFDLAPDADVAAFVKKVEESVDPRWNGCTEAEMTVVGAYDNSVFLIMCPTKIPSRISGKADIIEPSVEAGSASEALWNEFKAIMSAEGAPEVTSDIAAALASGSFGGEATAIESWEIVNEDAFVYTIDGFNNASIITNGDKTVYLIQLDEGMEIPNWAGYYLDGIKVQPSAWGSYNMTIIVMLNVG
jgi:hypothetical protein